MRHYCTQPNPDGCDACSMSNYGHDCQNNPTNQLAYLRAEAGLTQRQLADAANLPVTTISRLERGERSISGVSLKIAISIADALGVANLRDLL